MSELGWIDFSSDDQSKVRNILAMLSEPGTLDELGVGQVRDAFSDLLFPGISTIQTRAKYFITVPRIFRDYLILEPKKRKNIQKYFVEQENKLAIILDDVHCESEIGIIGRSRVKSDGVARRPSEIYWTGLRTYGIVKTKLSLADFCRQLDSNNLNRDILGEVSEDSSTAGIRSLIRLPDRSSNWMKEDKLCLQLSSKEAEFLKGRMIETPDIAASVPAQLFKHGLIDEVLAKNENRDVNSFDVLAGILDIHDEVARDCKNNIKLAREFSLAMEGPHIRYNIILARKNHHIDSAKKYEEEYGVWLDKVNSQNLFKPDSANDWLTAALKGDQRRIKTLSKNFIGACCNLLRENKSREELDQLVENQVKANKGSRSLLNRTLINDHWVGIRRLDYRWNAAKLIIKDIQEGLDADS